MIRTQSKTIDCRFTVAHKTNE